MTGRPDNRTQDELLHDLLNDGPPDEQRSILKRLQAIGEAEALDAVIHYLQDAPTETADTAFTALRVLATKYIPSDRYSFTESILSFLHSDEWEHRLAASRLLSTHPNELAIDELRDVIDAAQQQVYDERLNRFSPRRLVAERTLWESIMALANCGRLSVLPDINDMLDNPYLKPIATRALGVIGSETERPHLEELAEDQDVRVRDAAQWSLGLMDDRAAQFLLPPHEQPSPPPDRLSSIYWAHRQLHASDDNLTQFLIVRLAVEHLLLDDFLSEGRTPMASTIELREVDDITTSSNDAHLTEQSQAWLYQWHGPRLHSIEPPAKTRPKHGRIVMTVPDMLIWNGSGTIAVDSWFKSYRSNGWHYFVEYKQNGWTFARGRQVWSG